MADDLIIKFFKEDLTETEEVALGERLSSSVEEALRFGQHAEASYRHYGLPEPKWRGGPPPAGFPPSAGLTLGLWLGGALLTGLLAWGGWNYWKDKGNQNPASSSPTLPALSTSLLAANKAHSTDSLKKAVIPDSLAEAEPDKAESTSTLSAKAPESREKSVLPALTPMNAAVPGHRPHTNLEVLVNRAKPGPVTVQVLGPDGVQAVLLYQGMLQPGHWAFDWNGRLANGAAPPAGTYRIQVLSGAVTLSKSVILHK